MSDSQLETITKAVNSSPVAGIREVIPADEQHSSFIIELNNGHTLNELLPKGVAFLIDKKDPAAYSPRKNAIYFNPELLSNPSYLAMLAHECGHSLVKNPKKTESTYLEAGHEILYGGQFKSLPLEERLKKIHTLMQLDLDNETDASDHGKIVADLLGVDSIVYEDMVTISLQNHFWYMISGLEKIFEVSCPDLTDDTLVDYYDPFTREASQVTYGEFKTLSVKAKEENAKTMKEIRKRVNV